MANTVKTICLDFYGLPGSGKSTISHLLAENLGRNYAVSEPSYKIDHSNSKLCRVWAKLLAVFKLMTLYPKSFLQVVSIIKKCGYNIAHSDFYIHLLNICFKIYLLKKPRYEYVIFDQGLIQAVISLFYRKCNNVSLYSIYKDYSVLVSDSVKMVEVYIKVDIDTAIERMDKRNSNISRVQLLNRTERIVELKKQLIMMNCFENNEYVYDSGNLNIDECVNDILKRLNNDIPKIFGEASK